MTRPPLPAASPLPLAVSPNLLGAALAGLLCLAGCTKEDAPVTSPPSGSAGELGAGGAAAGTSAGGSSSVAGSSVMPAEAGGDAGGTSEMVEGGGAPAAAGQGGTSEVPAGGSPSSAGAGGGAGAAPMDYPHITSSENVGPMTVEQFTALCDKRSGTVEVMPHCGGFATAKGFSYDSTTQLLSEHTCKGTNTCAGWNCVVPD